MPDEEQNLPDPYNLDDDDLEDEDLDDNEGDEDEEDNEDDEPEIDLKALVARLDATERVNQQLRESVARFQSIAQRVSAMPEPDAKAQEAVQKSMDEVYDLLGVLADGADEALLDPAVKDRVSKTLAERRATRDRTSLEDKLAEMVRDAVGTRVPPASEAVQPVPDLNAAVAQLEADLVEEIKDHGLDPDDFDWQAASEVLGKGGPVALKKYIRDGIRTSIADDGRATRRQSRKASGGKTPRGGAPAGRAETVLKGTDLDAKRAYLRSLGIAGV